MFSHNPTLFIELNQGLFDLVMLDQRPFLHYFHRVKFAVLQFVTQITYFVV